MATWSAYPNNSGDTGNGTLRLLEASRAAAVPKFVYVSSSEVYGTAQWVPMTEDHPTMPCTVYGGAKLAGEAYTRAFQLCKESGFDEHTVPAVFGLFAWNLVSALLGEAQALSEHLLHTAAKMNDPAYKVIAHQALGFTLFAQGNFSAAHRSLECSMSLCEDSKIAQYLHLSGGQDPRIHVRLYDGMLLETEDWAE